MLTNAVGVSSGWAMVNAVDDYPPIVPEYVGLSARLVVMKDGLRTHPTGLASSTTKRLWDGVGFVSRWYKKAVVVAEKSNAEK